MSRYTHYMYLHVTVFQTWFRYKFIYKMILQKYKIIIYAIVPSMHESVAYISPPIFSFLTSRILQKFRVRND